MINHTNQNSKNKNNSQLIKNNISVPKNIYTLSSYTLSNSVSFPVSIIFTKQKHNPQSSWLHIENKGVRRFSLKRMISQITQRRCHSETKWGISSLVLALTCEILRCAYQWHLFLSFWHPSEWQFQLCHLYLNKVLTSFWVSEGQYKIMLYLLK